MVFYAKELEEERELKDNHHLEIWRFDDL